MSVVYIHLTYEDYKGLEEQMRAFKETAHQSTGGFYHKSIRLKVGSDMVMEFHGPLVGGYGHHDRQPAIPPPLPREQPTATDIGKVIP